MAFVYRSTSRNKFLDMNPIPLGPGEYDPEISKTEGRLIHQKNMKYTKVLKKSQSPQIIPFNSTSQRSPQKKKKKSPIFFIIIHHILSLKDF